MVKQSIDPLRHTCINRVIVRVFAVFFSSFLLLGCSDHLAAESVKLDLSHAYPPGTELFALKNGINEFELIHQDGYFYFFHHDFNTLKTYVRRAKTLDTLAGAEDSYVLPGLYPSAIYEQGRWHAWVYNGVKTVHYVSSSWNGPYVKQETINIYAASDWAVRKNPTDGRYYATYKDGISKMAMIMRAASPDGPWESLGLVFPPDKRASWYSAEQADPQVFFYGGRAYVGFAGWGGNTFKVDAAEQDIGLVELNPSTYQAERVATRMIRPTESWQMRGGGRKIFKPKFIDPTGNAPMLVYATNPSALGVPAGWAYVKLQTVNEKASARTQ